MQHAQQPTPLCPECGHLLHREGHPWTGVDRDKCLHCGWPNDDEPPKEAA